jgi:hypothetical protein
MKDLLGKSYSSEYTSLAAMVIESAALNMIFQTLAIIFWSPKMMKAVVGPVFDYSLVAQIQVCRRHVACFNPCSHLLNKRLPGILHIAYRLPRGERQSLHQRGLARRVNPITIQDIDKTF